MVKPPEPTIIRQVDTLLGDAQERLLSALRQGYAPQKACAIAGISYATYWTWMLRGADPGSRSKYRCPERIRVEPYWTFAREVRAAIEDGKRATPPGPPRGRTPALLTPEQQAVILDRLKQGWSYAAACRQANVTLSTFSSWLRLGGYPRQLSLHRAIDPAYVTEPYKSFATAVLAAEDSYFGS